MLHAIDVVQEISGPRKRKTCFSSISSRGSLVTAYADQEDARMRIDPTSQVLKAAVAIFFSAMISAASAQTPDQPKAYRGPKPGDFICNRTPMTLMAATALWPRSSNEADVEARVIGSEGLSILTFINGWFVLKPDECKSYSKDSLEIPKDHYRPIYVHAFSNTFDVGKRQYRWTGDDARNTPVSDMGSERGCVSDEIMRDETECKPGSRLVKFRELYISRMDKTVDLTLENADPITDEPIADRQNWDQAYAILRENTEPTQVVSSPSRENPNFATDVIEDRCLFMWDDSWQPRKGDLLKLTVKWKKLRHCVRLKARGPIEIEGVAKDFVKHCINKGTKDPAVEGAILTLIGLGVDVLSAGATSGSATSAALINYVNDVRKATMSCLISANEIETFVKEELRDQFKATVTKESWWVNS